MLQSIIDIGSSILGSMEVWESQLQTMPIRDKKDRQRYVVKIDFSTTDYSVNFDVLEEMDNESFKKYLTFGRYGGPNSRQWFVSHSSIYLISEVINQLINKHISDGLDDKLNIILDKYFYELKNTDEKYKYLLKYEVDNDDFNSLYKELISEKYKDYKKFLSTYDKELKKHIAKTNEIHQDQLGIFTIAIDGQPVALRDDYRSYITQFFSKQENSDKKAKSKCNICGSPSVNKVDFDIRYYTTNLITFSSKLEKKYDVNNFILCKSCFDCLRAGEKYIMSDLRVKIAGIDTYVIPQIICGQELDADDLKQITSKIKDKFNFANYGKKVESLLELEDAIDNILDYNDNDEDGYYYLVNLFMFQAANQAVKIKKIIKNINPSIFNKIINSEKKVKEFLNKYYKEKSHNSNGLNRLYYSIPISVDKGNPKDFRYIIDIYEAILTQRRLDKKRLIKSWNKSIKIVYLARFGFNVTPTKGQTINSKYRDILFAQLMLEEMGCITSERGEDLKLDVKDSLKEYIEEMNYNTEQASLFLLGYLMGQVGVEQGKRLDKKPILNKLNFNGMDKKRLIRLSNDVFNKLRQEKILKYHEKTHQEMYRLMSEKFNDWSLNSDENLFYILGGFSYRGYSKKEEGGELDD